jgi:hypothetical protein
MEYVSRTPHKFLHLYKLGVASDDKMAIQNFIKICQALFELRNADIHSRPPLYPFISCTSCKELI